MDYNEISVLYVDDEERNLEAFKASFRRDYKVFVAKSAVEAYHILSENEVPIIIADYRMPVTDGISFLSKAKSKYPDSVRILLTAYADIEAVIDAINLGRITFYLGKPWNKNELKACIQEGYSIFTNQKQKEFTIDELDMEIQSLKARLGYEYEHYFIKIDEEFQTAIKQYLLYFKDYVKNSKETKIHFEVRSVDNGIEIELKKNAELTEIKTYLSEYMNLIKQNEDVERINSKKEAIQNELDTTRLRSEIRHLKTNLELANIKYNLLSDTIDKITNFNAEGQANSMYLSYKS